MVSFALPATLASLLAGAVSRVAAQTERAHDLFAPPHLVPPSQSTDTSINASTHAKADFLVSGKSIPLLDATVQDSFAGRLPISANRNETRKLFFWYWPSSAPRGSDTLSIWLNGGPGCSSLIGSLSEHGTFTFRAGASAPSVNPYAWSTVSDMFYMDQPAGTGFSPGPSDVKDETDVAEEFYGFLRQFYAVFAELVRKKLFIAGESYAGAYIPYIARRIVTARKAERKNLPLELQGLLINDGFYDSRAVSIWLPLARFVVANQETLGFNDSIVKSVLETSISCGFDPILTQALAEYPPRGPLPPFGDDDLTDECHNGLEAAFEVVDDINPCFNIDDIRVKCPAPQDPINGYFSRPDVQQALHVSGFGAWSTCVDGVLSDPEGDLDDPRVMPAASIITSQRSAIGRMR